MRYVTNDGSEFSTEELALVYLRGLENKKSKALLRPLESMKLAPLPKIKNNRSDKGKPRTKYDSSLPKRYLSYLKRANSKKISFNLTVEQFDHILTLSCVYCGSRDRIGVDRVDSSIGYDQDNVAPCCCTCNMMKYTHDVDYFLRQVKRIYEFSVKNYLK